MAVFSSITPLPIRSSGLKPDADGELWNVGYTEIDANFTLLEGGSSNEFWKAGGGWAVPTGTGATNGHVVQDEGVSLTQRNLLNFVGDDVTATDETSFTQVFLDVWRTNLLINPEFSVLQRGAGITDFTSATTPANNDDTYLLDRWVLLSDGNDIVDVSQNSFTIPDGAHNSIKLLVSTINKQFGILQIIEGRNAREIIDGTASLSFDARMAAADDNTHSLKAVILSWDSTEDVVTSDVVSAWGATPTYVANWTAENTPDSKTLTTDWQTFTVEDIDIDTSGAKNVAVFIFCDQVDGAIGDAVFISRIKLGHSANASPYAQRQYGIEELLCQRYYWQGETAGGGSGYMNAHAALTFLDGAIVQYPVPMMTIPSVAIVTAPTYTGCSNQDLAVTSNLGFTHRVDTAGPIKYRVIGGVYEAEAEL